MKRGYDVRVAGVAMALAGTLATVASAAEPCYAGLRRSSYGLKPRNNDDVWWADRAQWLAGQLTSSARPVTPVIVQIVSIHLDSGVSRMEFARPAGRPIRWDWNSRRMLPSITRAPSRCTSAGA